MLAMVFACRLSRTRSEHSGPLRTLLLLGTLLTLSALPTTEASAQSVQIGNGNVVIGVPIASFATAFALSTTNPQAVPPGVNPQRCVLDAAHPYPVILVNGTFTTMLSSWGYLGPRLALEGYCVYSYNFGGDPRSPIQAVGPVPAGVEALAERVAAVLAATGASKVDLLGFSQGGLISELFTKFGGASFVHSVTALAPTTHGTTLLGIASLARQIPGALELVRAGGCPACSDQVVGSAVVNRLNEGPITVPGIPYTVIETIFEDVVTPVGSSFINEPGVVNQYTQQFALIDVNEHASLPFDPVTFTLTVNALRRARGN